MLLVIYLFRNEFREVISTLTLYNPKYRRMLWSIHCVNLAGSPQRRACLRVNSAQKRDTNGWRKDSAFHFLRGTLVFSVSLDFISWLPVQTLLLLLVFFSFLLQIQWPMAFCYRLSGQQPSTADPITN